jgi:hypothetical protein
VPAYLISPFEQSQESIVHHLIQPLTHLTMSETDHSCQAGPASLLDTLHSWDTHLASTTAGYSTRLYAGFYAISVLASLWVYFVARRLPPGALRGLACLPVVLLQLAATPLLVDRHRTAVLIVPVCGIFSLSAFKVSGGDLVDSQSCGVGFLECRGGTQGPNHVWFNLSEQTSSYGGCRV